MKGLNLMKLFIKKQDCCGCTACTNICPTQAITMQPDEEGFLYPVINGSLCVNCGVCTSVCPLQSLINIEEHLTEPLVFAVKHPSEDVRMSSSSGGAFTAISDKIIENNSSYTIYGAVFDKIDNFTVKHKGAYTTNGREEFKGSKYVQSNLGDIFKAVSQDLKQGKIVLFTGTPCQTAGLNNYLKKAVSKGKKGPAKNLILVDLICHGVTSPLLWTQYVDFIQKKYGSKLQDYTFRLKEIGWRGYNVRTVFENGISKVNTRDIKIYAQLFSSGLALRPACYECKFANMSRPSDITIGDFWGIEKCLLEMDDNKGVSLVLINTEKGKQLFELMKTNVYYKSSSAQDCLQHNLKSPTNRPSKRDLFWRMYNKIGFRYIILRFNLSTLKRFLCRILRLRKGCN